MSTLKRIVLGIVAVLVVAPVLHAQPSAGKRDKDKDRAAPSAPAPTDKSRARPSPPESRTGGGSAVSKDRAGSPADASRAARERKNAEHGDGERGTGASTQSNESEGGIETAVLVFDASKSMADPLGSVPKMKAAKQAVGALVAKWDRDIPLGLTAYGHRGTGCSDIDVLAPVGTLRPKTFTSKVNALRPRGFSPLAEAVIRAAEQLDYEHNQATIIVVSDGADTCHADPCEMAELLESRALDLRIDVIGVGVTEPDGERQLACMARATGGKYQNVHDETALGSALKTAVTDVGERKARWRARWGGAWGKNGRWRHGSWKHGKRHSHRYWDELRERWRNAHRAPPPHRGDGKHPAARNETRRKPPKGAPPSVPARPGRDKTVDTPAPPARSKGRKNVSPPPTPSNRDK